MQKDIFITGIAGQSCSGKSTLAKKLHQEFAFDSVHIDMYRFFIKSADFNCKNPSKAELLAIKEISVKLNILKNGDSVDFPIFDCSKKQYLSWKPYHLDPAKYIFIEGTMILWN